MTRPAADPLHKATLTFKQHGVGIELHALEGVFAGAGVDAGTRHLLRWLAADRYAGARTVLDLGCGYGPLALWLAAADPARRVAAVDRDARALDATARGAAANGVRIELHGSLGYDDVGPGRFDLVTANVPAKVGPAALRHLVLDARHHLTDDGSVALVVVDRLAEPVADLLADPAVEILDVRPTRAYTAFEYRFVGDPAGSSRVSGFDRGLYRRGRATFRAGRLSWDADVAWSIPEFDALGHGTLAAVDALPPRPTGTAVVVDVGQGHLPLALRAAGHIGPIRLVDRDLLALRTTAASLGGSDSPDLRHRAVPTTDDIDGADLVVIGLPEREPVATTAAILGPVLAAAAVAAPVVLYGRVADVNRVLELLPRHGARLAEVRRTRHRAHAAVVLGPQRPRNSVTPPA